MMVSNKTNLFYLLLAFFNILIFFVLNKISFIVDFNLVNLIFPILNIISVFIILLIIIFNLKNDNDLNSNFNYFYYSIIFVFFININLIIFGSTNIEFYAFNLTSSLEYIKNVLDFKILAWSDSRALGTPFPIIPSFHFNPILYLGYFLNLKYFYLIIFISHSFLGIFYMMKISHIFIKNSYLNIFNGFLFTFSCPLINYMIQDDWLASFVSYSLLPLLIYVLLRLILTDSRYNFYRITVLSLFLFYYYYNGNPSFHIFLFFIFTVFIIFSFILNLKPANFKNILIISLVVFILIIPNIIHIIIELSKFKYDIQSINTNKYFASHWFRLIDNLFPFVSTDRHIIQFVFFEKLINQNYLDSIKILLTNFLEHGYRTYFIGLIYFILSIISLFFLRKNSKNSKNLKILSIFLFILFISHFLMHFKSFYFFYLIDENYFGIFYIFIGIILGTFTLDKLLIKYRKFVSILIFLHGMQVLTYASLGIFILKNSQDNQTYSTNHFNINIDNKFYKWLDSLQLHSNEKIIFSPKIQEDLNKEEAVYKEYNLFSIQDIYLKKNIRVINDSFLKGISYDNILISRSKKHGNLDVNNKIFLNKSNLDILGSDIFIIKDHEIALYPFIKDLEYISSIKINKIERLLVDKKIIKDDSNRNLYHKFDKFLLNKNNIVIEEWYAYKNHNSFGDLFAINYPYNEKDKFFLYNDYCLYVSFLCQNNSNLLQNKIKFTYHLDGKDGSYKVKFDSTKDKIIIVFNKIYRNEWKAKYLNTELRVFPIHNSLVGIEIPAGIDEIKIVYENKLLQVFNYISFFILIILIISLPFSYHSMNKRLYKSD
jgi:hypothetical protein